MDNTTSVPAVLDVWCDLQCPDCHQAESDLDALRERFGPDLEIRRRHFPLPRHQHAHAAAQAAEEAYAQGLGEEFTRTLLSRTSDLGRHGTLVLREVARQVGVDDEEVDTALIDGRHLLIVDADQAEGQALGVTGTPTYMIGGHRLDGGVSQEGVRERLAEIAAGLLAARG